MPLQMTEKGTYNKTDARTPSESRAQEAAPRLCGDPRAAPLCPVPRAPGVRWHQGRSVAAKPESPPQSSETRGHVTHFTEIKLLI